MISIEKFKQLACDYLLTELIETVSSQKAINVIALTSVLPTIIDSFIDSQRDYLIATGVLDLEDNINVDEAEKVYGSLSECKILDITLNQKELFQYIKKELI